MAELKPLIAYIVDQVGDQGGTIGRTALMKLVYLADIEHYRRYGKQATNLQWRFHHYGPYSAELDREVRALGLDIDESVFTQTQGGRAVSGYHYRRIGDWREVARAFNSNYDAAARRCVDRVVVQWGLDSLPTILDYVYFETEPMQDARRGETLDFSKVQPESPSRSSVAQPGLSKELASEMRQRLHERKETAAKKEVRKATEPPYDNVYEEACRVMAEDEGSLYFAPNAKLSGPNRE